MSRFFFLPTVGNAFKKTGSRFFEKSHLSHLLPVLISDEINFENTYLIFE